MGKIAAYEEEAREQLAQCEADGEAMAAEIAGLRAELARKDAALREYQPHIDTMRAVIENRGQAYPTDRDGIRGMVDAAMKLFEIEVRSRTLLSSSPSQASVVVPREPTEAMLEAALDESGNRVLPYDAPRESGVPTECDMSEADAAQINRELKESYADTYRAMLKAAGAPNV